MKTLFALPLTVVALLSGCAPFVPTVQMKDLPPEKQQAVNNVKLWNSSQLIGQKFTVVSMVEGNSCKHLLTDPPASRIAALNHAKYQALEAGANGLAAVQCGAREAGSLETNCYELITCTAEAIQMTP